MLVYPVGNINPFTPVNAYLVQPNGHRGINPRKNKVYLDPRTGELTTWQPGIYIPEEQKKPKNTFKKLLALAGAALLAYIFRGKIKAGGKFVLEKAQPYVQKAYAKCVELAGKAGEFLKPRIIRGAEALGKGLEKIRPYTEKFVDKYVKPTA